MNKLEQSINSYLQDETKLYQDWYESFSVIAHSPQLRKNRSQRRECIFDRLKSR